MEITKTPSATTTANAATIKVVREPTPQISEAYERFEALARGLTSVPKAEIAERQKGTER
jgi:hypothetical protein